MFASEVLNLAEAVLDACRARGWHVATAKSCTGGLVAAALTAIAGSSDVVERGFVDLFERGQIGVAGRAAEHHRSSWCGQRRDRRGNGAGAIVRAPVDLAVSITGVAGPGGGSAAKPVGLVIFGLARRGGPCHTERHVFPGDRDAVRDAALKLALGLLAGAAKSE